MAAGGAMMVSPGWQRHEGVEVRDGARGHADLGETASNTSAASSAAMTSISSMASSPISYLSPG
jgi:hypothetical protein